MIVQGGNYEAMAAPIPSQVYPPPDIVCTNEITARCAQDAADRAGFPVAWMPSSPSPHLSLVAIPSASVRVVFEHALRPGTLGALEIMSPSLTGSPSGAVIRTLHAHGLTATMRRPATDETVDQVLIEWAYRGRPYVMTAIAVFRRFSADQIDEIARLWTTLRYAQPR
jgi:hypothetical protein